jgi:hypothetical protein
MSTKQPRPPPRRPLSIRLPGFVADRDIGLGDAITRVGRAVGLRPCGGCTQRAAQLNRLLVFTPRRR